MYRQIIVCLFIGFNLLSTCAYAERIKDLASVAGVRDNFLTGYGLVVGLDGTGDQTSQTPFTIQSFNNMLRQYGITLPPGVSPQLKNVAAVTLHANLPAFSKPGQVIDVTASSIGNSASLRGGSLLLSPLYGADGQVYAVAQGSLVVSGFGIDSGDGSSVTVNVPSTGRIPNGAIVERAVPNPFVQGDKITLNLHRGDFTTAKRVVKAVTNVLGPGSAAALDNVSIQVQAPADPSKRVEFMAFLEELTVQPGEASAKVIINSRTGNSGH